MSTISDELKERDLRTSDSVCCQLWFQALVRHWRPADKRQVQRHVNVLRRSVNLDTSTLFSCANFRLCSDGGHYINIVMFIISPRFATRAACEISFDESEKMEKCQIMKNGFEKFSRWELPSSAENVAFFLLPAFEKLSRLTFINWLCLDPRITFLFSTFIC